MYLYPRNGRGNPVENEKEYLSAVYEIYNHGGKGAGTLKEKKERLNFTRQALKTLCPGFEKIKIAHIAGSCGKGSTAIFLHSILSRKKRTGLITSPHLFDFNERIQLNRTVIHHTQLAHLWRKLLPELLKFEREYGERALFQDIVLLLGFRFFLKHEVEWAVVEVGLGGRFDQSNALDTTLSIITRIGLDHTQILGNTLPEIAREKAGIIRPGVEVHTLKPDKESKEAFRVIQETAERLEAPLITVQPEKIRFMRGCRGMNFSLHGERFWIPVAGRHQTENAALSISAANSVSGIELKDIKKGLESSRLPGRIELRDRLIMDIGHNTTELRALFNTLRVCLPSGKRVVVCGFADTKDHYGMLKEVMGFADAVVITQSEYRGADPMRLLEIASTYARAEEKTVIVEKDPVIALRKGNSLLKTQKNEGFLVVTGSTFLIDEIFNPNLSLRALNSGRWDMKIKESTKIKE